MRRSLVACLLTIVLILPSAALGADARESERAATGQAVELLANMVDAESDGRRLSLSGSEVTAHGLDITSMDLAVDPGSTVEVVSLAGLDRFETAVRVSQRTYPKGSEAVIITNGYNWPDAMSGASLAGMIDAPILLTPTAALPRSIVDEIVRLEAGTAIILGGTGAVSSAIESELVRRMGRDAVLRIDGRDRYETSAKIAHLVLDVQEAVFGYHQGVSFIATGADFPDALGASSLAAATWFPIVLVNPAGLGPASISVLQRGATDAAIMLGGTGALPTSTATAIASLTGRQPLRLGGTDRYDTAREAATWGVNVLGLQWDGVALATGRDFPDALSGSVMQGRSLSVMLLTPDTGLPASVAKTLSDNTDSIYEVRYLGGTGAVRQVVRDQVEAILYKESVRTVPGPMDPVPDTLWEPSADLPSTGNYVYLDSDPGDYIGLGREYLYTPSDAVISVTEEAGILSVRVDGNERWNGEFTGPDAMDALEAGYYPDLERYPFHSPLWGGLSWSGQGRGSNTLTGWFVVDSVTYDQGVLKAIELRFEQHSEGGVPALHGSMRWAAGN